MNRDTDQLLEKLNQAQSMTAFFEENKATFVDCAIGEYIRLEMQKRKYSKAKMIRDTGINKRYFMDILSGKKTPHRRYVLRIFLALGLDLNDVQWYLKACAYHQLYTRNKRDCVIIYCINHRLSVVECNAMLNKLGQENLGFENI